MLVNPYIHVSIKLCVSGDELDERYRFGNRMVKDFSSTPLYNDLDVLWKHKV